MDAAGEEGQPGFDAIFEQQIRFPFMILGSSDRSAESNPRIIGSFSPCT